MSLITETVTPKTNYKKNERVSQIGTTYIPEKLAFDTMKLYLDKSAKNGMLTKFTTSITEETFTTKNVFCLKKNGSYGEVLTLQSRREFKLLFRECTQCVFYIADRSSKVTYYGEK